MNHAPTQLTVLDLAMIIDSSPYDEEGLDERAGEYLGDNWRKQDHSRLIDVTMPLHCTRIDSETSYSWA